MIEALPVLQISGLEFLQDVEGADQNRLEAKVGVGHHPYGEQWVGGLVAKCAAEHDLSGRRIRAALQRARLELQRLERLEDSRAVEAIGPIRRAEFGGQHLRVSPGSTIGSPADCDHFVGVRAGNRSERDQP